MMFQNGVEVEAPSPDPKTWRVYVPVGNVKLEFMFFPGKGPWCLRGKRPDRGSTRVEYSQFLVAKREAARRFAELSARNKEQVAS